MAGQRTSFRATRTVTSGFGGVVFGLIDESEPLRGDWVELYPDRLGFHEPWNGLYDT